MKKPFLLLPVACTLPMLFGCSTTPNSAMQAENDLRVEPVMSVRHSKKLSSDHYQIGRYYQGQNRLEKAARYYRKVEENHQDYIDAQNALGKIYARQGKLDKAVATFKEIIAQRPQLAKAHNNLGYTYFLQGKYVQAIATFEAALSLSPQNIYAKNNISMALGKSNTSQASQYAQTHTHGLVVSDRPRARNNVPTPKKTNKLKVVPEKAKSALPILTAKTLGEQQEAPTVKSVDRETAPIVTQLSTTICETTIGASPTHNLVSTLSQTASSSLAQTERVDLRQLSSQKTIIHAQEVPQEKTLPEQKSKHAQLLARKKKPFRLEIANGNGVTGMAKRTSNVLKQMGLPTARLTNIKPFQQPRTIIRYRVGHLEQALFVQKKLARKPILQAYSGLSHRTDVQLILGRDVASQMALYGTDHPKTQVAINKKSKSKNEG